MPMRFPEDPAIEAQRAVRECLRCGRKFKSAWAGNRICRTCKETRREPAYIPKIVRSVPAFKLVDEAS
jgi:ribosomal protein L37AE/L43A